MMDTIDNSKKERNFLLASSVWNSSKINCKIGLIINLEELQCLFSYS